MTEMVTVTAMTHRGAVRTSNQDALTIGGLTAVGVDMSDPIVVTLPAPTLVAVTDGLGGHAHGEVAAAHVAQRLAGHAHVLTDLDPLGGLLHSINQELYEIGRGDPDCAGTGACVAGLAISAREVLWFGVGDVRVYRENGGYLGQVSVDDSPARARSDPDLPADKTGVVLQSLGGTATPTPIDPHLGAERTGQPGRWLLCSDGLSDLVEVTVMEAILTGAGDDARAVKELWAAAMNASGRDNITIALVRTAQGWCSSRWKHRVRSTPTRGHGCRRASSI